MMAPRITGNLRAVAADPSDARSIYVGTEEGTLVHTNDGGVSWEEIELSSFLLESPTVPINIWTVDPYRAIDVWAGFNVRVPIAGGVDFEPYNPLVRRPADRSYLPVAAPPLTPTFDPLFVNPMRQSSGKESEVLLNATAGKDARSHENVRRVTVCPGGASKVLVTTSTKLLGSPDGAGATFVPLFTARESAPIGGVACSPTNPNEVILATGDGTFRSTDGGASFDPVGGAFGPVGSSVVAFGAPGEGRSPVFVASGRDLWTGDPSVVDGMHVVAISPESTAIRDVVATAQSVWVVTETGVRFSRDAGATWSAVDELEGAAWDSVAITPAGTGREHVTVLREDAAFESPPGSTVFRASFRAQSRRRLRQVVALPTAQGSPPSFLLVTSGELWTTSATDRSSPVRDDRTRRWAEQRLSHMPSLSGTLDRALVKAHLSSAQVEELADRMKLRGWLPSLGLTAAVLFESVTTKNLATLTNPTASTNTQSDRVLVMAADLIWELPDVVLPAYNFSLARKNLYDMQKQLSFVVEDAYVERRQVLTQLAAGGLDTEQLLSLEARLELLDLVLQQFAGDPAPRSAE